MLFIFLLEAFFSFNLIRCPYDFLLSMKFMISESSSVFTGRCWWRKGQAIPQAQRTPSYATETGMFIARHCKSRLGKLGLETFELNKRSKKKLFLLLFRRHDTTVSLRLSLIFIPWHLNMPCFYRKPHDDFCFFIHSSVHALTLRNGTN